MALVCLTTFLAACTGDDDPLPMAGVDAELLVEDYNYYLDEDVPEHERAFAAVGAVTGVQLAEITEGEDRLSFVFQEDKDAVQRVVTVDVEEDIEFPASIDEAKVIYLGDHLIVVDLESDFFVHLTTGGENLIPELPAFEGNDLTVRLKSPPSRPANSK